MTAAAAADRPDNHRRWQSPIDLGRYNTTPALRGPEKGAIAELGLDKPASASPP